MIDLTNHQFEILCGLLRAVVLEQRATGEYCRAIMEEGEGRFFTRDEVRARATCWRDRVSDLLRMADE